MDTMGYRVIKDHYETIRHTRCSRLDAPRSGSIFAPQIWQNNKTHTARQIRCLATLTWKEKNRTILLSIFHLLQCVCFCFFNAYFHCECENILAVVGLLMENLSKIHQLETHFASLVGVSQPWKEMKVHRWHNTLLKVWSGIIVPWHKIENVKNGQLGSVELKTSKTSPLANRKKSISSAQLPAGFFVLWIWRGKGKRSIKRLHL